MAIDIKGGTVKFHSTPLCSICKHAVSMQGAAINNKIVYCMRISERILFDVFKCSDYLYKYDLEPWEFEKIAWTLETSDDKKVIGFKPPDKKKSHIDDY